jgi:hypothetical protein
MAWLSNGTADWFWPAAEKAGIPVMFLAPGNLPTFARIAERHPRRRRPIRRSPIRIAT